MQNLQNKLINNNLFGYFTVTLTPLSLRSVCLEVLYEDIHLLFLCVKDDVKLFLHIPTHLFPKGWREYLLLFETLQEN